METIHNTTNLYKHLQGHSDEYKKFWETKATKREEIEANSQASAQVKLKPLYKIYLKKESHFLQIILVLKK